MTHIASIPMSTDPSQLLRRLSPPIDPAASNRQRRASFDAADFDGLLDVAMSRAWASDRPVKSGSLSGDEALDREQTARLAAAVDTAEMSGFDRALVLLDGRGLIVDVESREVVRELLGGEAAQRIDVDGAVMAAGDEQNTATTRPAYPSAGWRRAELLAPHETADHGSVQDENDPDATRATG